MIINNNGSIPQALLEKILHATPAKKRRTDEAQPGSKQSEPTKDAAQDNEWAQAILRNVPNQNNQTTPIQPSFGLCIPCPESMILSCCSVLEDFSQHSI